FVRSQRITGGINIAHSPADKSESRRIPTYTNHGFEKRRKKMRKTLTRFLGAALVLGALAAVAVSQVQTTTVTKVQTVQNPDGTYTIVEYPIGKETTVILNP